MGVAFDCDDQKVQVAGHICPDQEARNSQKQKQTENTLPTSWEPFPEFSIFLSKHYHQLEEQLLNKTVPAGGALHVQTTKTVRRVKPSGLDGAITFLSSKQRWLLAQDLHRIKPLSILAWRTEGLTKSPPPAGQLMVSWGKESVSFKDGSPSGMALHACMYKPYSCFSISCRHKNNR